MVALEGHDLCGLMTMPKQQDDRYGWMTVLFARRWSVWVADGT